VSPQSCPHPEEFSALLDRESAPENIPGLEGHVDSCPACRQLVFRLTAADRAFKLILGKVDIVNEIHRISAGKEDHLSDDLQEELEAYGEQAIARIAKVASNQAGLGRRRIFRRLVLSMVLLVAGVGLVLQPSAVQDLGQASRDGLHVTAPKNGCVITLYGGAKVKLSPDARVRFRCCFRWDWPLALPERGKLTMVSGTMFVRHGGRPEPVSAGAIIGVDSDGKITVTEPVKEDQPVKKPADGEKTSTAVETKDTSKPGTTE
jgi:hypothetical protein